MQGELQRIVGERLRAIRKDRGLSQEEFAELLGIHRTYMGGLERGERNITLRTLEQIAETLGVEAVELVVNNSATSRRDAKTSASAQVLAEGV
jgi:transcriptional regulator with XRE-family HTH domain